MVPDTVIRPTANPDPNITNTVKFSVTATVSDPNGIDEEKLAWIMDLKNIKRGRIKDYAKEFKCDYLDGKRPWSIPCDIALPCASVIVIIVLLKVAFT